MLKLSVLDQSVAIDGQAQAQSIRETLEFARYCEDLGYFRFWVSEHHNHPTIVGSAPEILMAAIAATTRRIRIGSAGVMLPHYSPLKVAEQFRVLDAIAPGRIDLGLGRAPGSDGKTAYALNPNAGTAADQFPSSVRDLMAWVSGQALADNHPFAAIRAFPQGETGPEPWMLGTSDYGAQVAAHFGIPYCFAHFITDGRGVAQAFDLYRQNYQPSEAYPEPKATVCVWALAAKTDAHARYLYASRAHNKVMRDYGQLGPLISPDAALAYPYTAAQKAHFERLTAEAIIGDGAAVADQLRTMAKTFEIDEIVVLSWTFDQAERMRSYELLADAFDLKG
ncbi:MAG: LLM class flavin-dependent oxidoreductase [Rhodospirillales bacterium]|nr:LLM class flavin-dependent oxidoreductase [Rhodospirillales bacterium]